MNDLGRLALVLSALLPLGVSCGSSQAYRDRDQSQAMEAVIRAQEAAWNRGDLDGYMSEGYVRSPDVTFFSGGDVTRGYDRVLERYRKSYREDNREMGRLSFSDLETLVYSHDFGIVRGRWRLDFLDGSENGGLFTLVLERTPEGWRIVHDHTSVDRKG